MEPYGVIMPQLVKSFVPVDKYYTFTLFFGGVISLALGNSRELKQSCCVWVTVVCNASQKTTTKYALFVESLVLILYVMQCCDLSLDGYKK